MLIDSEDGVVQVGDRATTDTYENKRKMLFESLNAAEKCIKGTILEQKNERPPNKYAVLGDEQALVGKKFQGKESIFKKPAMPISKCLKPRRTPDYQVTVLCLIFQSGFYNVFFIKVNPHKWKKYTLDDADTSERTNAAAAFDFLREIENRKRAGGDIDGDDGLRDVDDEMDGGAPFKIMYKSRKRAPNAVATSFNNSVHLKAIVEGGGAETEDDKPVLRGCKVVMPEYVVGQRMAREKKVSTVVKETVAATHKVLKLGHLFEDEDDDSEQECISNKAN